MSKHTDSILRVVNRPSVGINLEWGPDDGKCRPICHMRWTDGLRPEIEARVLADANRLADCWNALAGLNPEAINRFVNAAKAVLKSGPWQPEYNELLAAITELEAHK